MSILVVGSIALDTVKTPFGMAKDVLGGSATYFSVSASFFEPDVNLVAIVGDDFPAKYVNLLEGKGIDLKGMVTGKGKTFRWEGEYGWDFSNPRTIATRLNVLSRFNPAIPREYRNSEYVFLANIDPQIQKQVLNQMARPKLVACDTMNYWIENKRKDLVKLLKKVDIFLLNEAEAKELAGESSLVKAAKAILKFGPKRIIIKKGEHGSLLFSGNSVFSTPAYLMESIFDPTGAGDTFAGGLVGYLAACKTQNQAGLADRQANLRKAIVYGSVMATFAVEDFSLRRLASITRADIVRRFKQFRKLTHF
ncbi:MAG: bifunctional hydroxymethylpyrimidine kinase/phosphomethylpyrimidine kinase [Candidatus Omnitrophota bacterium]|nr:MAG: bifunctional hydroxymethylpyrimidine kinase/phosphomethylpyrimidine kinase [Candidatus Omnitrophota bacterium]